MILFIKILLAHIVGDFLLQPKSWVRNKEQKKINSWLLYLHALLHGALIVLFLWDFSLWLPALILMIAHWLIDVIKLYAQNTKSKTMWFLFDQGLHLVSIFVVWYLMFKPAGSDFSVLASSNIWVYATALLLLTAVSNIVIQVVMSIWSKALNDGKDQSLSNAGKYIGMLERLFVFTFVITGHWSAIGFLLAAKSVFRFGDLTESKDRKLTEYILIGTLLSFGIALATGMIVLKVIEIL